MNGDRRWPRASVVRVRVLTAGLLLLGAGWVFLGWSSHSRHSDAGFANFVSSEHQGTSWLEIPANQEPPAGDPAAKENDAVKLQARSLFAGLPLIFEPNQGQANLDPADRRARFVTRGAGYSLFLGSEGAILSMVSQERSTGAALRQDVSKRDSAMPDAAQSHIRVESLQVKLAGANPDARLMATDPLPGKSNYLIGNDPAKWRRNIPQFARVGYEQIYPGIDLVFYGNQGRLEYDFQVAPGADPAQAELEFEGARRLEVKDGALVIHGAYNSVQLSTPRMYQLIAGREQPIEGGFVLRGTNRAGFAVGAYDHSRELVIDPILTFSTYFGGSGNELATSVVVDTAFNIYLTGSTTSPNLPVTPGVKQTTLNGAQNVYIAKISPPLQSTPAALIYVTYLGGSGTDSPVGIAVNGSFEPFIAGTTSSPNFPVSATPYQLKPYAGSTGTAHAFVSALADDFSTLLYSSYLSGNGTDTASGMAIDASGNIYVTGTTTSNNAANSATGIEFPASEPPQSAQAFQLLPNAGIQFFVTKVNTLAPGVTSIAFSTYFGGSSAGTSPPIAVGGNIAVDTNGNVYFTGTTNFLYTGCVGCGDFPILNAFQPCLDQAPPTLIVNPPSCTYTTTPTAPDAFVTRLNPNPVQGVQGGQLVWSTYLGGSATDSGTGIGVDVGAANVYVTGTTNSVDIGSNVTTLSQSLAYERCLDNATFNTTTNSCNSPAGTAPYPSDAFVARITNTTPSSSNPTPNVALNYFSYLGGTGNEEGLALTVDSASGAVVTGWTQSVDFPTFPPSNPIQSALSGTQDAFIARLNTAATVGEPTTGSWATYFGGSTTSTGGSATTEGTGVALDVNETTYFAGDTNSTNLPVNKPLAASQGGAYNGGFDAFVTQLGSAVSLSLTGVLTLGTSQTYISAGNQATFTYTLTNNGPDLATGITVTDNLSPVFTQVPLTFVSASASTGTCGGISTAASVSCFIPSLQAGSTATVTIVVTPTASNSPSGPATFNGGTVQATGQGNIVLAQTSVPAQMSDFKMTVAPNNASVPAAGDTAVYQVYLTPLPVYSTNVTLSCTGLPTGAACNFTNSPVTLLGPASSQLNLTTTVRPLVPTTSLLTRHFYAIWFVLPGLVFFGMGAGRGKRRGLIAGMFLLCVVFLLLPLPGCSHTTTQPPVSGTPAGTYTITVSGTSGSDTRNQSITLVVP